MDARIGLFYARYCLAPPSYARMSCRGAESMCFETRILTAIFETSAKRVFPPGLHLSLDVQVTVSCVEAHTKN